MKRWATSTILALVLAACSDSGDAASEQASVTVADPPVPAAESISYGSDPLQFGELTIPAGAGPHPVVVFIHGGFWRNQYELTLSAPQVADAVANGYAAWNIEYRRVGDDGGGYPGTLEDVAAAVDLLASLADDHQLDLGRVAVVGHSAGGHLALWVGQRTRINSGQPGSDPLVTPALVVGQAPVADLASNLDLGAGAVEQFMGAIPTDEPGWYGVADPAQLLPIVTPQLIVHGADDPIVPADRSAAYVDLVDDPDGLELLVFEGADHFDVIRADHESWTAVVARLP